MEEVANALQHVKSSRKSIVTLKTHARATGIVALGVLDLYLDQVMALLHFHTVITMLVLAFSDLVLEVMVVVG